MSSENVERPFFLRVEASDGYDSQDNPIRSGQAGELVLNQEAARDAVDGIRAAVVQRLDYDLALLTVLRHGCPDGEKDQINGGLDFGAPNQPTEDQIEALLTRADRIVEALQVLRQLAPWTYDDGDDDGDDDRAPAPEPAGSECA